MSDFWKIRMEAEWTYEQYNKGNVGLFYKVYALVPLSPEDGGGVGYSPICELIRTEQVAVSIVEDHNAARAAKLRS